MAQTKMRKSTIPKKGGDEDRGTSIRWWCLRRERGGPRREEVRVLVTSKGGFELEVCEDRAGCTLELTKGAVET